MTRPMRKWSLAFVSCLSFLPVGAFATEQIDGQYVWNFLSGEEWPIGYGQSTGKPQDLSWHYNDYSRDFFDRINNALPEASVNEAFLTDDSGANITLSQSAEVFITFLHEGAGYRNSFGYFTYDSENPPRSPEDVEEIIVFPNLSYPHLTSGHRLSIGTFPAGTSIGFFIAANGFSYYTGVKSSAVPYYYSLKDLNPDPTDELRQHNVLLHDEEVSEIVIGFEDLPRTWGDNDFNDAIFSVRSSPESAINTESIVSMPDVDDSDADGVSDSEDEFPSDYNRAYSSYYPSNSDWITLAFEDNWPNVGDYDMNDLVIRERYQTVYNAAGEVSGMIVSGFIDARGASFHNGFGLRLMNIAPESIADGELTINGESYGKTPEADQSDAVFILWQDTHVFTETNGVGSCKHFNTVKDCPQFDPIPFSLDISFEESINPIPHADLDFFLFRTNYRGREIHFADYPPTDLFDFTQLGRKDDTSNEDSGRYFRSEHNLPWALKIPTAWRYPREYIDVVWAYPDFETWVESSGEEAIDWFSTSERDTHYYKTAK